MVKMMKIVIIVSILSAVCGTQYAYLNNKLVGFNDPISLPYPYQDPNLLNVGQRPVGLGNAIGVGVVPAVIPTPEIIPSPLNLLCSLVSSALGCLKRSVMYIITSIPSFIYGCFSLCNLSSFCNYSNLQSFLNVPGLNSIITTDRLKRAAEFFETAIRKYRTDQN